MAEDCCDAAETWEDLEDSGELDKRLKNIDVKTGNSSNKSKMVKQNVNPSLLKEETNRTTYQPQVRILKRNTDQKKHSERNNSAGQQSQGRWRPLEERAAAYAEARMRIFGQADCGSELSASGGNSSGNSAASRLDGSDSNAYAVVSIATHPSLPTSASSPSLQQQNKPQQQHLQHAQQQHVRHSSMPRAASYTETNIARQMQTLKVNSDSVRVVRQPRGPDGSKGFTKR